MFAAQCLWSGAMTAAAKGEVLYYRRLYCAFVHCGLLDQASPLTHIHAQDQHHLSLSLALTSIWYVLRWHPSLSESDRSLQDLLSDSSLIGGLTKSRQGTSEGLFFLYISSLFQPFLGCMSASAIFCNIPDTFHKLYFFLFFHWMNRRKILQWIFTGELFQLVYQTPQSEHPRWCKNKLHDYIVETVLTTQASSYLYFCAPKLNSLPVRLASPG